MCIVYQSSSFVVHQLSVMWKYRSVLQFPVLYRIYSSIVGLWCGIYRDSAESSKNLSTKYQSTSDGAGISQFKR